MKETLEKKVVDGVIVEEEKVVVEEEEVIVDDELDEDNGDNDGDDGEKEIWLADEGDQKSLDVPISTHIKMKRKLKGRLSDSNEEVERLKRENEALKLSITPVITKTKEPLKRPREEEYDTIQEYDEAITEYDDEMLQRRLHAANAKNAAMSAQAAVKINLDKAVDAHYERASKLIQDNGIDTEVYKQTDLIVREAIESIRPGQGDIVADQVISILGEGSEKVLYYLGRNKNALDKFKSLLADDSSGLKASMFLGQQRERLLNSKRRISAAPSPDDDVTGDNNIATSNKANAFLKKRKAALKKGDVQLAYDVKKQAKAGGIDVSTW